MRLKLNWINLLIWIALLTFCFAFWVVVVMFIIAFMIGGIMHG